MRGGLRIRSTLLLLSFLTPVLAAGACQKRGAAPGLVHPALTPADSNRDRLVARVLVPAFDRTAATVDQMHAQGALPFGAAELRNMLLARLSLPEDALSLVDTGRPIALALVSPSSAPPGAETPLMMAGALALRAPEGAGAFFQRLGTLVGSDREIFQLRRQDGEPIWVLHVGQTLAWAATREALVEAGAHALDARVDASDDLVLTGYPGPWARSRGVDLRQGSGPLRDQLVQSWGTREGRPRAAADRAALEAILDFVLRPAPETDAVEARLALGKDRGADIAVRVRPRPGSAFATRTAVKHPYPPEAAPVLAAEGAAPVTVASVGDDPAYLQLLLAVLQAQARAGVDGAGSTAQRLEPLLGELSGGLLGVLRPAGPELAAEMALPLRAGAPAARAQGELGAFLSGPGLTPLLGHMYRRPPLVRSARDGDRTRVEVGDSFTVLAAVAGGKVLLATEPQGAERINQLAAARPAGRPAADTPLGSALDESRGKDGLIYVDVLGVVGPVMSAASPGAARMVNGLLSMPGLAGRKLPVWLSFGGGDALALDLRVPLSSLTTAAGLMGFFGRDG
jgi:hypothetical protein